MPAVTDCFKTQKICDDAVRRDPYYLPFIPDNLKTQVMCEKVVKDNLWNVEYVPEHLKTKTKEMCEKAVKDGRWSLRYASEHLKTTEMCKKVVRDGPWHLEYVIFRDHHIIAKPKPTTAGQEWPLRLALWRKFYNSHGKYKPELNEYFVSMSVKFCYVLCRKCLWYFLATSQSSKFTCTQ